MTDIRDKILDTADELLARYGYRKMTIDDLARGAGIGKGTIYLHFPSKEEVALSTVDRIVDRVIAKHQEIAATDAPAAERLAAMLEARVLVRFDAVRHFPESVGELLANLRGQLLQRRADHFRREKRVLKSVLDEGLASGEFAMDDSGEVAQALLTVTNSLLPYSLSTSELGRRADIRRQVERVADLALRGLLVTVTN